MKDYKEFSFGWLMFVFVPPVLVFITYLFLNDLGNNPLTIYGYITVIIVTGLVCLLFYGLTTRVTPEKIKVSFGIGLITKTILLNRIKTIEEVRNPWYYGWGIRIIPKGMLFNISGAKGIELKFTDSNRIVRIGSQNPFVLKQEIEKRLTQFKQP